MCGIHLILDKQQQLASEAPLARMMQESDYRGPDASGTRRIDQPDHTVWLGSQRLQVSDPHERADQPFTSPDGRYTLLYNGEIYNYYELRNELLPEGTRFVTQSDTEVLLHWLIHRGMSGLGALNGMFAFMFYDRQTATLQVARDRFGMKPLYYAESDAYLLVSSEAKSIAASGLVSQSLRTASVAPYLCFRYPPKGTTFFAEVAQLKEGQLLTAVGQHSSPPTDYEEKDPKEARDSNPSLPMLPTPSASLSSLPEATLTHQLEQTLTEAVLRHWAADVPVGLFLSGGVDSTLLLALLRQEGLSVPTFSLGHEEADRSYGTRDAPFARRAATQYDAYHEEISVSLGDLEENFDDFIRHTDQPVGDSGAFMTYWLAKAARPRVKVVLSGAGADELFGGYQRHAAYRQYLRRYGLMAKARPLARTVARWLPTGGKHPLRQSFRLLNKFATDLADDPTETWTNFISLAPFRPANGAWPDEAFAPSPQAERPAHSPGDFVEEHLHYALRHDQQHYLVSDVLAISDSMTLAHGLEMRLPYLDAELHKLVNDLPAMLRLRHGRKWLLRRILASKGGKVYTQRRKEGFGLPFGSWLRDPQLPLARRYLEASDLLIYRYVAHERVVHLLRQHRRGQHDYSQELWTVLTLAAWLDRHFPDT